VQLPRPLASSPAPTCRSPPCPPWTRRACLEDLSPTSSIRPSLMA
jgi:hypothetical protein